MTRDEFSISLSITPFVAVALDYSAEPPRVVRSTGSLGKRRTECDAHVRRDNDGPQRMLSVRIGIDPDAFWGSHEDLEGDRPSTTVEGMAYALGGLADL